MLRRLSLICLLAVAPVMVMPFQSAATVTQSGALTAPEIIDGDYVSFTASHEFPVSTNDMSSWIYGGLKLLVARESTEHFESPVDVVAIRGVWPAVGAIRRIELADGHFATEEALIAEPGYFKYIVWNMTRPTLAGLDYVVAEYRLTPNANGGSKFSWNYHLMTNENFVSAGTADLAEVGIQPLMDDTLNSLYYLAKSHFDFED